MSVVLSCEHGGNLVPPPYRDRFASSAAREALESHRGWDPGSVGIAEGLAALLRAPLVTQRVTRLLVECNRSLGHPRLWSEFSRGLKPPEKEIVLARYWHAHRDAVRAMIDEVDEGRAVVHVGVHTFTPVWKGRPRATDVGLLYDPARAAEARLAHVWRDELAAALEAGRDSGADPRLKVHLNRPYRGWTDGLVTALRAELGEDRYLGFELEVSQARAPASGALIEAIAGSLQAALSAVLA